MIALNSEEQQGRSGHLVAQLREEADRAKAEAGLPWIVDFPDLFGCALPAHLPGRAGAGVAA